MGLICFARYDKLDCVWLVISRSGHVVERWPTREQACAAVARLAAETGSGLHLKKEGE